jgi:hypothetical protein
MQAVIAENNPIEHLETHSINLPPPPILPANPTHPKTGHLTLTLTPPLPAQPVHLPLIAPLLDRSALRGSAPQARAAQPRSRIADEREREAAACEGLRAGEPGDRQAKGDD